MAVVGCRCCLRSMDRPVPQTTSATLGGAVLDAIPTLPCLAKFDFANLPTNVQWSSLCTTVKRAPYFILTVANKSIFKHSMGYSPLLVATSQDTHRDGNDPDIDRVTYSFPQGPTYKPSLYIMKVMETNDGRVLRGPFSSKEEATLCITKDPGRIVVGGPTALGCTSRIVHSVLRVEVENPPWRRSARGGRRWLLGCGPAPIVPTR
ncbi:unnamed protein product [Discosporangium mesarthrocarpum]